MQQYSFRKVMVKAMVLLGMAIIGFLAGSLLVKALGQATAIKKPGIFYQISGKGMQQPSYLLGTYHLLKSGYINQYPAITEAFQQTKGVVVEVELDSAAMSTAASMGLLQNGTLSSLLDKPFADSLNAELLQTLGAPLQAVDQLSPANVMITLALVQTMRDNDSLLNAYSGTPMDQSVANAGKKMGMNLTALETIAQQMDFLFNSYTIEEQTQQLKAFLRTKAQGRQMGNDLIKAYLAHDLPAMEALYKASLELSGQEDTMVKDRNLAWMKVLPALLQQESQFIAVGALHLAGEFGLVKLLQQQGFTVTPIVLQ